MIDGVDVNDNLFGTRNNLFIEDAIEETRCSRRASPPSTAASRGGVDQRHHQERRQHVLGQLPQQPLEPAWTDETPCETTPRTRRPDKLNTTTKATFGGPILRDRLWFFNAGRWQNTQHLDDAAETAPAVRHRPVEEQALEFKGTGTVAANHTVPGAATSGTRPTRSQPPLRLQSIDPRRVVESRASRTSCSSPASNGVLTRHAASPRVQVSQKKYGFRGTGGTDTDIHASPFITPGRRRACRHAALQRAVLRRHRPRGSQQPPVRRQPVVLPDHAERRQPRLQGRLRALQVEPDRRQLADVHRLRVRRRLPAGASGVPALDGSGSGHPDLRARACRSSRTGCRRAAPSSTSARCRSTCRITGRRPRLTLDLGVRYER